MIDYIFGSSQIKCIGRYGLPEKPLLLPSDKLGSDHIVIVGHYVF